MDAQTEERWEKLSQELLRLRSVDKDNADLKVRLARLEQKLAVSSDLEDSPTDTDDETIMRVSQIIWPACVLDWIEIKEAQVLRVQLDDHTMLAVRGDTREQAKRRMRGALIGVAFADRMR